MNRCNRFFFKFFIYISNLRAEMEEPRSISKIQKGNRVGRELSEKARKQWTGMPAGYCPSQGVRCRKILAVGHSGSIRPWQCISARQGKRAWAHLVVSISDSSTSIWEHDTLGGPSRAYNNESYLEEKDFGVTRNRLHARSSVSILLSLSLSPSAHSHGKKERAQPEPRFLPAILLRARDKRAGWIEITKWVKQRIWNSRDFVCSTPFGYADVSRKIKQVLGK